MSQPEDVSVPPNEGVPSHEDVPSRDAPSARRGAQPPSEQPPLSRPDRGQETTARQGRVTGEHPRSGRDRIAGQAPGEATPRAHAARGRAVLRLLVAVLAIAGATFLILWLPPSDEVRTDVTATVLAYELAGEATWPKGAPLGLPLSPSAEHMLAVTLRTRVARVAAGNALESFDAAAVATAFADAAAVDPVHVVTRWKGEIVYFDFVRHALPNGVIVRAGVLKAQRVGRVDALHQRVFARRWVWHEGAEVDEYTLRQTDGAWKVVDVEPWGTCGPDGEDVIEGRQPM